MNSVYTHKFKQARVYKSSLVALRNHLISIKPKLSSRSSEQLDEWIISLDDGLYLLRKWNLFRIAMKRPSTLLLKGLVSTGNATATYANAWSHQYTSEDDRKKNKKIDKETVLDKRIIPTIHQVTELRNYASELKSAFGVHDHVLGDRPYALLLALTTGIIGVISGPTIKNVMNFSPTINPNSKTFITEQFNYVPPKNTSPISSLQNADCWKSNVSQRGDAKKCSSGSRISDPCFVDMYGNHIVTCPLDPHNPKANVIYAFSLVNSEEIVNPISTAEVNTPWFIITNSGSKCFYASGTSLFAANQRFNYFCTHGEEAYLTQPGSNKSTATYGCISKTDSTTIKQCMVKEIWY